MSAEHADKKSSILAELAWRDLIKQQTHEELDEALHGASLTLYAGFDPTADSLHAGHLLPVVALAHFRRHGHAPIALVGGATGLIGDPSGKSSERDLLDDASIERNVEGIRVQLRQILDRAMTLHTESLPSAKPTDDGEPIPILNNADWMKPWSYIGFLRDVGKHFRVNAMLAKDSVRDRLENREQGISYTEFSYMLIQAYDFLHLAREHRCTLQIGGSDQWGNITAGTELIRRTLDDTSAFGLTLPLLTDSQGRKYGKSEGNAIWLDPARTSPYEFYQYWYNLSDEDIPRLLRVFTFLPQDEVESLSAQISAKQDPQQVKARFAREMTLLVHGEEAADKAVKISRMLFGEQIGGLSDKELAALFKDAPSLEIARARLEEGAPILDLLVEGELQKSKSEARRLLQQGGVYINNLPFGQTERPVTLQDLASESMLVLRAGKKKQCVVRLV